MRHANHKEDRYEQVGQIKKMAEGQLWQIKNRSGTGEE